jgi:MoaA/NifB/PqqE/SkfB family radical SAM enzyme
MLTKLRHLRLINSVDWRSALRTLAHLYPDYYSKRGTTHSLANVTLELTYRCNWKCDFCFLKNNVLNRRVDELTYDEILDIIDQVAHHHMGFYITGGEPFVRRDCIDIVRAIKQRGLKVGVNTNSHILDEAKIDELKEIGLDYLISSVHGPEEVHNQVTGVRSYHKAMANLVYWKSNNGKNGKRCRTKILINYVITPDTAGHMNDLVHIAHEAKVDALTFQHETFLTRKDRLRHDALWQDLFGKPNDVELSFLDFDPAKYDVVELTERIASAKALARRLGVPTFFKPDLRGEGLTNWYGDDFYHDGRCSYLYTDARINPRGDVITCQFIPKVVGNIREEKLMDIMNNAAFVEQRKKIQEAGGLFPACARCCKLHRAF